MLIAVDFDFNSAALCASAVDKSLVHVQGQSPFVHHHQHLSSQTVRLQCEAVFSDDDCDKGQNIATIAKCDSLTFSVILIDEIDQYLDFSDKYFFITISINFSLFLDISVARDKPAHASHELHISRRHFLHQVA